MVSRGPATPYRPIPVVPIRDTPGAAPCTSAIPARAGLPRVAVARDLNQGVRRRGSPSEGVAL